MRATAAVTGFLASFKGIAVIWTTPSSIINGQSHSIRMTPTSRRLWQAARLSRTLEEGIDRIREAMRLNPYHPEWYWVNLGSVLYEAGKYADAAEAFGRVTGPDIG